MIRFAALTIALLGAGLLAGATAPAQTALAVNKLLFIEPAVGHSGTTIFISGCCFDPHKELTFLVACPYWFEHSAAVDHNFQVGGIAKTDANGAFAGFAFRGFRLHVLRSAPCRVYAQYAGTDATSPVSFYVEDAPGLYFIADKDTPLPLDSRRIRARIQLHLQHAKSGLIEHIHLERGWGGAVATILVTLPRGQRLQYIKRLDYEGRADLQVPLGSSAVHVDRAQVAVKFRLGAVNGFASASFKVLR